MKRYPHDLQSGIMSKQKAGPISDFPLSQRIVFYPPKYNKPAEVPASDVVFSHWSVLSECHLVVVTVNPNDSPSCGNKLAEVLENHKKRIPIFSIQRGVKYGVSLSEEMESKGLTVIESVIGFGVVIDPKYSAYVATTYSPSILYTRLSKEEVAIADKPLSILETMPLDASFRKFLTSHAWGLFIYEQLYLLNVFTKGTLCDTLQHRSYRLLYALMIRETIEVLHAAARGGKWRPELLLVSSYLTPKLLELVVLLPEPFFTFIFWFFGLFPREKVISPAQLDLMEGRKTVACSNLQELIEVGGRNDGSAPFLSYLLELLRSIEAAQEAHIGARSYNNYNAVNYMPQIEQMARQLYPTHHSMQEMFHHVLRFGALLSLLVLLAFLFYHD